jgi:hypothetical protein
MLRRFHVLEELQRGFTTAQMPEGDAPFPFLSRRCQLPPQLLADAGAGPSSGVNGCGSRSPRFVSAFHCQHLRFK